MSKRVICGTVLTTPTQHFPNSASLLNLPSFLFIQLNAQLRYSRLKLTLKSSMFRLTNHHQGA